MPNINYETAADVITLMADHDQHTTIQTPMFTNLRIDHHTEFSVAARAIRGDLPMNFETGERLQNLDFDLAYAPSSNFTRLTSAIERATQAAANRRFNP